MRTMSTVKERYELLVSKTDDFERDIITEAMSSFAEYVKCVVSQQIEMPVISLRYEGEDFRSRVLTLDRKRNDAHESAINACRILNRACKMNDFEAFCPDPDKATRYEVGDFCAIITVEIFRWGTHGESLDSLVEELVGKGV